MDGLILMGGKSSRMQGQRKELLSYEGKTFAERLTEELRGIVDILWISYGQEVGRRYAECEMVTDLYPECGPMGGIHAGLKACKTDMLLVAACDMPMLKAELFVYLKKQLADAEQKTGQSYDGVVPVAHGRMHPLAAIYRKSMAGILEMEIKKGNYRMRDVLEKQRILYADVSKDVRIMNKYGQMLRNVNTVKDYEALIHVQG